MLGELTSLEEYRKFERQFLAQVRNLHGSMRLPHAGTSRQVPYERLFVPPTLRLASKGPSEGGLPTPPAPPDAPVALGDVLGSCVRGVLLGDPGGGKSTSSLKLAYDVASCRVEGVGAKVPFLVVLKDYAEQYAKQRTSMLGWIAGLCETPYGVEAPSGAIEYLLLNGRALVIFDGLDELLDTSLRRDVVRVVEGLVHQYRQPPPLSRRGAWAMRRPRSIPISLRPCNCSSSVGSRSRPTSGGGSAWTTR